MLPAIKAKAKFHVGNPSLLTQRGNCCCCFLEAMPSRHLLKRSSCRVWSSQIPRHSHVTARDVFRIKDTVRESVYPKLLRIWRSGNLTCAVLVEKQKMTWFISTGSSLCTGLLSEITRTSGDVGTLNHVIVACVTLSCNDHWSIMF